MTFDGEPMLTDLRQIFGRGPLKCVCGDSQGIGVKTRREVEMADREKLVTSKEQFVECGTRGARPSLERATVRRMA